MDSRVQDNNKMATAPLGKLMAELAVPTVFAQLVNLLYNMVDRIYVGRIPEVGHLALAGLGVTFPVIILISAFAALVGAGGAPQAAICMGKKDMKGAERILGNCITALCILAVVLSVFFPLRKEEYLKGQKRKSEDKKGGPGPGAGPGSVPVHHAGYGMPGAADV